MTSRLLENDTTTISLLSLGQRGVGKTVFLAGSYTELRADIQARLSRKLWFDSRETQLKDNIESILNYVAQTGHYPPPTVKITSFDFSLKCSRFWGEQTLCHFRWWDVPGEDCKLSNRDYLELVSNSQGCCVFIDAYALVHNPTYLREQEGLIETAITIVETALDLASRVVVNDFKYTCALILTKCDLLEPGSFSQQLLEDKLRPLTSRLSAIKANYQTFYSCVPIVYKEHTATLEAKGAARPLLWLLQELSKAHDSSYNSSKPRKLPTTTRASKKLQTSQRWLLLLSLVVIGCVEIFAIFIGRHQSPTQREHRLEQIERP